MDREKITATLDFELFDKFNHMSLDDLIRWCEAAKEEHSEYDKLFLYSCYGEEYQLCLAGKRDINDREIATREKMVKKEEARQLSHYEHLKRKYGDG